jgi:hypothetical protein
MVKMIPQIVDAVVASCTDDTWPPEVQDCLVAASVTDSNAAERCLDKLPPGAKDAFMKRVEALVQAGMQTSPPPPPPPPAPPSP